jgi:hypothetical protein
MVKKNKTLIDKQFEIWINNSPESWHDLDMYRFYAMTWACVIYGRTHRGSEWLRDKINSSEHNLTENDIDEYCDLFVKLQKFAGSRRFWRKHNKAYGNEPK